MKQSELHRGNILIGKIFSGLVAAPGLAGVIKRVLDVSSWRLRILRILCTGNTITFPPVLIVEDFLLVLSISP
ncbi:hypothetical protein EAY67_22935 [Salmonella enterica]|nr:hypothetical protein CHD23_03445 [Salmonella enterica]EBX0544193.1 hypothetical protein [Salmonella enterica subsp. houtenae serovar 44:z4,z23:-]ECE5934933.1 hypothetical protein [Salmonella enterica subsp. houtenae]EAN2927009.1 hypothetical protein [Salmonella enterica]EAP4907222.1 hypothetical protein [Salmonella enterica]